MTCNTLKKSIRCLACLALILALSLSLIPAPAYASAAMPDIGSSALLEFKAFGTIPVFNSADCSVRGCAAPQQAAGRLFSCLPTCPAQKAISDR